MLRIGFFCCKGNKTGQKIKFFRLAVWATYENGETIGLLSTMKDDTFYLSKPCIDGFYIHFDELNDDQKEEALIQGSISPTTLSAWERE